MKKRIIHTLLVAVALCALLAPGAIAADLADVGFIDQAAIGSLPAFANANAQLAQYKQQLDGQFAAAMKAAKSDADRQRISLEFQQKLSDKQRELIGPIFAQAQYAIAQVSATKNLSIVVDKRIIVYGGQDITKDVEGALSSSQAVAPPSASPPPSQIGFVDQSALDAMPKLKAASDEMAKYADDQRKIFGQQAAAAKTDADKQKIAADFRKALDDKQQSLLKPIVDETQRVTADAAKKHGLLLVIDRGDVVYGGTDITKDVQDALSK